MTKFFKQADNMSEQYYKANLYIPLSLSEYASKVPSSELH